MPRYGRGYTSGRYVRRNVDEAGLGYESDYIGGSYGYGWPTDQEARRRTREYGEWGSRGRPRHGDIDEGWESVRRRRSYGEERRGGYGDRPGGEFGEFDRDWYDRDLRTEWRVPRYEGDYGARYRRGRMGRPAEFRSWSARGYEGGW